MPVKLNLWILSAVLCMAASSPAGAEGVYKCGQGRTTTYSQTPCAPHRVINTDDAPVPAKGNPEKVDARRLEQNRAASRSLRRLPGETVAQYDQRRHRARMLATDRDECARLDTRMPVEQARMKSPMKEEVQDAEAALAASRKRFAELRC